MEQSPLTGLEYFWFSRGQLAAARHPRQDTPGPEVAMAVLMEDIVKDARTYVDGPKSLRRVADRLTLAAEEAERPGGASPVGAVATATDPYPAALRSFAASFIAAATEIEVWKRRWPEPASLAANPETSDGVQA
jgi:hypothetical protein